MTTPATIARPRPAPARPRPRPGSARQNRRNSSLGSSVGSPGPWSRTASVASPLRVATDTSIGVPAGVCTSALRMRLASTWRSCPGSPSTTAPPPPSSAISRSGATARASSTASAASAAQVDRLADLLADLVEAREREQVLDEHAHPRRLVLDPRHRLRDVLGLRGGADPEELGVAADRRQRRAQLVRRVGQEAAQALLARAPLGERLLQAREHRVERQAEAADLRARLGRLDAPPEVAGGDRARGRADRVQRAQPDPHDPPGAEAERQQDRAEDERLDQQQPRQRRVDVGQRDRAPRRTTPPGVGPRHDAVARAAVGVDGQAPARPRARRAAAVPRAPTRRPAAAG